MRAFPFLLAASLALLACESQPGTSAGDAEASSRLLPGKAFVTGTRLLRSAKARPGRYIVVLEDKAALQASTERVASELATLHGASVGHTYSRALHGFVATMPEANARLLSLDPRVRYVEEDGMATSDSAQASPAWGLDRMDQRSLPLDQSYSYSRTGSGVHVYLLDSGLLTTHLELRWRAHWEYDAVGAGYGGLDCNGHGTHVAGIIAGNTYGVAKGAELHLVRVLGCDGAGYFSDIINGVEWVTANHLKPAVATMAMNGTSSQAMDEAVARSINAGVTYVVSAGNNQTDACYSSPARIPAAITVGATTSADTRVYYSNFGSCVDLFAPGVDILSSWNGADGATRVNSGTSMSTAHVAGAAALYLEGNPTATPQQVADALVRRATLDKVIDPGAGSANRLLYTACAVAEVTAPPQVALTGLTAGSMLSGTVNLAATASDDVGVVKVEFYDGTHLLGTDTSPPYELAWDSSTASNGPSTLTARAYDDSCNWTASAGVAVSLQNAGNADFNAQWQVPACTSVGGRCDTVWLVEGRGGQGPEPHAPNTLGGTCADGGNRLQQAAPALDRLAIFRSDGSAFAPGKRVTLQATVRANPKYWLEFLDIYSAPDANNPTWTLITTLQATGLGAQVLTTSFMLPNGSMQALRGVYRTQGSPQACNPDLVNDHDDIVFAVGQESDSTPPTVAISSPAPGATVEQVVTLEVAASDDFGVSRVELYDGTTLIGSNTTPPFAVRWTTKGLPNGPHPLTARAYDVAGFSATSAPVEVILNNDVTPPQVAFVSPAEGSTVSMGVQLEASASDDRGGSVRVQFYWLPPSYVSIGSTSTAPYRMSWDSRNSSNGSRQFYVKATDEAGNSTLSGPLTLVIDNDYTPPTVALTSPGDGAVLSGLLSFEATATDDRQINWVYFFVDGRLAGESNTPPYTAPWDTTVETNGSHTLTAQAYDSSNNLATSAARTVTVSNHGGAAYDPARGVPTCDTVSDYCDSGRLLFSRSTGETHSPNTLDGCADGYFNSHSPATVDRIRVSRPDGTPLNAGQRARIEVLVHSQSSGMESLELYYTGDAAQPTWTYLTTLRPGSYPSQTFTAEYQLPSGSMQAVRARYRIADGASSWCMSSQDDYDDLAFAVGQVPDTTGPTTVLTSPAASAVLTGPVTLTATASDDFQVTSVEFYDGTVLLGTDASEPYSLSLNSWNLANGSHSLTAVGRDAAGNAGPSSPVVVTVNNDHASLLTTITAPTAGTVLLGSVNISVTVGNPSKVARVLFYVGTRPLGNAYYPPYAYTWNTAAEPVGDYTLSTRTYDAAGNFELSAPVTVTVARDTVAPTVALATPAPGSTLSGTVSVTSNATDNASVTRVELYVDGALLRTSYGPPDFYTTWNTRTVANGSHTLRLKAYDEAGNVGTSADASVTVFNDITPPTVAITAPAEGAVVTGLITLSASASDDRAVSRVEFFVDGALVNVAYGTPSSASWNSHSVAYGAHTLLAKAYDTSGNVGVSASRSITVAPADVTPPVAAIISPASNTLVGGTVTVTASASDASGVAKVEFYDGGVLLGTDTTAPYTVSWNTVGTPEGSHSLYARAYDNVGLSGNSTAVAFIVDNTAPTVAVTGPTATFLQGTVQVTATANDNRAVTRVEFYDGAVLIGTTTTSPYSVSWNTTGLPAGPRTLYAKAYDAVGNVQQASRTVTVDNTPPTVAITSPGNGGTVFLSTTIQATAADSSGVTQVVFYDGATVIGTDTTAPYSVSWNTMFAARGAHTLTARATDAAGNVATSVGVAVTVQ